MARSRNIKPGFFKNDQLAECQPLARLLFAGLWCEADRSGRLLDRPKKIKVECLPYDDCDCDKLLEELRTAGFIARYQVGDVSYIQVLAFEKHQNPHKNEALSELPEIPTGPIRKEHSTSTVQEQKKAEALGLIPDSLNLIPDSLQHPCASPTGEAPLSGPQRSDPIPYQAIADLYNAKMTGIPKLRDMTPKRRTLIRSAWAASKARQDLRFWDAYFDVCAGDDFLNGTGPYREPHANWRPSFDHLLKSDVVTRVFERAMDAMERAA